MAAAPLKTEVVKPTTIAPAAVATARTATRQAATVAAEAASSTTTLSPSKIGQIDSIVADGRSMAKQVIRMGKGSSDSQVKANAKLAKTYDDNLATIKASARGIGSDREADKLIGQAKQTRAYVQFLLNQSNKAN